MMRLKGSESLNESWPVRVHVNRQEEEGVRGDKQPAASCTSSSSASSAAASGARGAALRCEALIDARRTAELLGIHEKTVKEKAAAGEIPGLKIGKLWRFRESDLDDWIRAQLHCNRRSRAEQERLQ